MAMSTLSHNAMNQTFQSLDLKAKNFLEAFGTPPSPDALPHLHLTVRMHYLHYLLLEPHVPPHVF